MILAGICGSKSSARLTISNICNIRGKHMKNIWTTRNIQVYESMKLTGQTVWTSKVSV
jgi:hypothetical protein